MPAMQCYSFTYAQLEEHLYREETTLISIRPTFYQDFVMQNQKDSEFGIHLWIQLSLILEAWQYHILKILQTVAWYKHLNWSLFILEHHFESFSHFYILGISNCHSTNSASHPVPTSKRQSLTKLDGLSAVFLLKIIAFLEIGSQTS